jgi:CHAT domain-containing protein
MPNETLEQFEKRTREAEREYQQQAAELSRLVLAPVASEIAGTKHVLIVSDGLLRYIPFEALPVPGASVQQPLDGRKSLTGQGNGQSALEANRRAPLMVEKYILTYQPSASVMSALRAYPRRSATKLIAVFADPVFDTKDDRVKIAGKEPVSSPTAQMARASQGFSRRGLSATDDRPALDRLVSSLREANEILKLIPTEAGMKAVGFNASRRAAMLPNLSQYKILHFATHGLLDDRHPELSSIVLSLVDEEGKPQDGYLQLNDIYNLSLPVDLVVLSACRTGIGKEVKGEGLIGLTRGFMYAGAARVVASLWKVDTDDTAELMSLFYKQMLKGHKSPSAALQSAQIEMLKRPDKSAPYHWAGFVLQGEWK